MEMGPLMQVRLTILDAHAKVLEDKEQDIPSVEGTVLIDTGAKRTAVDMDTAKRIGLPVKGRARLTTASQNNLLVPVFAGKLRIVGANIDINVPTGLVGVDLSDDPNDTIALIGRDLLRVATLNYNGPEGVVTVAI